MRIVIVETPMMSRKRPNLIKELFKAENVSVYSETHPQHNVFRGDQVLLEGSGKDFNDWLSQFGNVWFNFGAMQFEQFELVDMSERPLKED